MSRSFVVAVALAIGCDGVMAPTFPCGSSGGSCRTEGEICLINGPCSTCVPLPASCAEGAACGCVDPAEMAGWDTPCTRDPTCDDVTGMTLDCPSEDWSCG